MSDDSARLGLPYLAAGQMQKHVTLNQALTRLDALVQAAVVSRATAAQPPAPPDGDLYILPEGAVGVDWSGRAAGALVRAEGGGWTAVAAPPGMVAAVLDEGLLVVRLDDGWRDLGAALGAAQGLTGLGLNAVADADNPLSARLNRALLAALAPADGGTGDLRLTLNKTAAADVLSLLFQSGWQGRAEIGLVGDDDLAFRVSQDGAVWRDAIRLERATGRAWFARGALRTETTILDADGGFAPPAWARWIEARATGGGGGGGDGAHGPGARLGGGGGGAGGESFGRWSVEALADALAVTVGAGGAPGAAGQDSRIVSAGVTLLTARGGGAGASPLGGPGGAGDREGNVGGDAAIAGAGPGGSEARPRSPGGGGAGGSLDDGGAAGPGGSGGVGDLCGRAAAAGTDALDGPGGGGHGGAASASGAGAGGQDGGLAGGGAGRSAGGRGGAGGGGRVWLTAIG